MLNENEVYQLLKPYVENLGWIVLGGEPPGGTDHIPVIELKDPANLSGGSKGSKKIDLVFFRDNNFLLLELKEIFAQSDVDKLDDIVSSDVWRKSFFNAIRDKSIHLRHNIPLTENNESQYHLIKALGFNKKDGLSLPDYILFHVNENNSVEIECGTKITDKIKNLF
jgi:hypothetical protein